MSDKLRIPGYEYDVSNLISANLQKAIAELAFLDSTIADCDLGSFSESMQAGLSFLLSKVLEDFNGVAEQLEETNLLI